MESKKPQLSVPEQNKSVEAISESSAIEVKMIKEIFEVLKNYHFEGLIQLISPKVREALNRNHKVIKNNLVKNGLHIFNKISTKAEYDQFISEKIFRLDSLKTRLQTVDFTSEEFREITESISVENAEGEKLNKNLLLINNLIAVELKTEKLFNTLLNIEVNLLEKIVPEDEFNFFILADFADVFSGIEIDQMLNVVIGSVSGKNYNIGDYTINSRDLWLLFIYQTYTILARMYSTRVRNRDKLLQQISPELIEIYNNLRLTEDNYIGINRRWGMDINIENADEYYISGIEKMAARYLNELSLTSPLRRMNQDEMNTVYPQCVSKIQDMILSRFMVSTGTNNEAEQLTNLTLSIASNFNNLLALEPSTINQAIKSLQGEIENDDSLSEVLNTVDPDLLSNEGLIKSLKKDEKAEIISLLKQAEQSIYLQYKNLQPESQIYRELKEGCQLIVYANADMLSKQKNIILQLLFNPKESYNIKSNEARFLKLATAQVDYPLFETSGDKVIPTLVFKEVFYKFIKDCISNPNEQNSINDESKESDEYIIGNGFFVSVKDSQQKLDQLNGNKKSIKQKIIRTLKNIQTAGSLDAYIHSAYQAQPVYPKQGAHKLNGEFSKINHCAFKFTGTGIRLVVAQSQDANSKLNVYIGDYHDQLRKVNSKLL